MVRRSLRTRSVKKMKIRTPGGQTVTHFRGSKPGKSICGRCGAHLPGLTVGTGTELSNTPSSSKRPGRPFGGVLCTGCLDELVRYVTRVEVKYVSPEYSNLNIQRDLTLEKYLPRGWYPKAQGGYIILTSAKSKPKKKASSAPKPLEKPKAKPKTKKSK